MLLGFAGLDRKRSQTICFLRLESRRLRQTGFAAEPELSGGKEVVNVKLVIAEKLPKAPWT